jgi:hypothetical protein
MPVDGKPWAWAQPVSLDYWKYLSEVIQPEPIESRDKIMLAMLVPLGIEKGKPFNPKLPMGNMSRPQRCSASGDS